MSETTIFRGARRDDMPSIRELLRVSYNDDLRSYVLKGLEADGSHQLHQSRIAEIDGRIVSYVRVFRRPIHYGEAVLEMGGIGSVCTLPNYRGRGLASAVLEDSAAYMRAVGYHLSVLFAGRTWFYGRLGWASVPAYSFRCALRPVRELATQSPYAVRQFLPERDLSAVESIYGEYNRRRVGPHVRTHEYWTDDLARLYDVLPSVVAERDGIVVAYASFRARGEILLVYEGACRDGESSAFRSLARAIVDEAVASGVNTLEGSLPRGHGLLAALRQINGAPVEGHLREHTMLRTVDLAGLLRAARPTLSRRLAARPWPGGPGASLGLRVRGEQVRLAAGADGLVVDDGPVERVVYLPSDLFFALFLGTTPASQVREAAEVAGARLSAEDVAMLDSLFPPEEHVYWRADRF